jgi:hypothetical protein
LTYNLTVMSTIVCGCGRKVEEVADHAGQWITCPGCGGALYQPFPGPKPSTPTVFEEFPSETRLCAVCAETIPVADAVCKYCRGNPNGVAPVRPVAAPPPAPAASLTTDVGTVPLVVGLVGWVMCGLLSPLGWIMASKQEGECRAKGIPITSILQAAKVVGIIGTVYLGISVMFFALRVVLMCL